MNLQIDNASKQRLIALGKSFPKAGARALNKLKRSTKSFISSEIRAGYTIKKKDIDPSISFLTNATEGTLQTGLRAKSRGRIPLFKFAPSPSTVTNPQRGRGVKAKVKRGTKHLYPHTFIAQMKSGHTGVFIRTREKNQKGRSKIVELVTLNITQLFASDTMKQRVAKFVNERLPTILKQELKYLLKSS